jgi:hypothetical protein
MASKAAYGANVNAGRNVNADNGWGSYKWPGGVPSNLLGTFSYQQVGGLKQRLTGTVRAELVELFTLAAALADRKHGYQIYANRNGQAWGPWTYENRAIAGTSSASNHSRGRAWDVNAPNNPYSSAFITDLPPALVNDWERIGLSWGGRYSGSQDTMHFEYAWTPGDVAGHVALAKQLLGGSAVGTAPAKPAAPATPNPAAPAAPTAEEDDDDMKLQLCNLAGIDYAYGPGIWYQIPDFDRFNLGEVFGLWGGKGSSRKFGDDEGGRAQLGTLRAMCLGELAPTPGGVVHSAVTQQDYPLMQMLSFIDNNAHTAATAPKG